MVLLLGAVGGAQLQDVGVVRRVVVGGEALRVAPAAVVPVAPVRLHVRLVTLRHTTKLQVCVVCV